MWPFIYQNIPSSRLVITQNTVVPDTGKPGQLVVPGVVRTDTKDGHLFGYDRMGNAVVVVPLDQVSAAVVETQP